MDQTEIETDSLSKHEPIIEFKKLQRPPPVPKELTEKIARIIYHGNGDASSELAKTQKNYPSNLVPLYVLSTIDNPHREVISFEERISSGWILKIVFFAFIDEMPNTAQYEIKYSNDPYRTRLLASKNGKKARCDASRWVSVENGRDSFFAHPVRVPGSSQFHIDFAMNPDRYGVFISDKPEWKWQRCFSFYAYKAKKIYVLECSDPLTYKILEGNSIDRAVKQDEDSGGHRWDCILVFYAFEDHIPGTNQYFIQERKDPHHRTRIGMAPSHKREWKHLTSFWTWDVPLPGTSKYAIQYMTPGVDVNYSSAEQSRVNIDHAWGDWGHKSYFYAYPADRV